MNRLLLALLLLTTACASSAQTLQGIKGEDNRLIVEAAEAPWSAVGRVNVSLYRTRSYCTGALIGPRLVLTAAHCLWNKGARTWAPVQSMHFTAGYSRGDYLAQSEVAAFTTGSSFDPGKPYHANTGDWALLELKRDIGLEVGYFGIRPMPLAILARSGKVTQVGYSQDHKHVQTANLACTFFDGQSNGVALHGCDAVNGDSGSPLFVWNDGSFLILAIHIATVGTSEGQVLGGAVPVSVFYGRAMELGAAISSFEGSLSRAPVTTVNRLLPQLGGGDIRSVEHRLGLPERGQATGEVLGRMLSALP